MESWILGFGIWNTAQGMGNPTSPLYDVMFVLAVPLFQIIYSRQFLHEVTVAILVQKTMKRIKQKICGDWLFSHVKTFFCFNQPAQRLTTVVKAIFVFTVKKCSQPLNSLLLEIHVPFLTNLASIFLTFSVTRAIVSSVFRGQDDIEEGLLTCDDVELKCCCGEKRTLLLLFFNVCCCFFSGDLQEVP